MCQRASQRANQDPTKTTSAIVNTPAPSTVPPTPPPVPALLNSVVRVQYAGTVISTAISGTALPLHCSTSPYSSSIGTAAFVFSSPSLLVSSRLTKPAVVTGTYRWLPYSPPVRAFMGVAHRVHHPPCSSSCMERR